MSLHSQRQLDNTTEKLRKLEERHQRLKAKTNDVDHVRELTLQSLKGLMNQLREEIVRYKAGALAPTSQRIRTDQQLENAKAKLCRLEEHSRRRRETTEDVNGRQLSLQSVKRTINQLKEEIICYEARAKVKS